MSSFHDSDVCRSILENLPAGLCVVDTQKKIVFWSDGAERISGHLRHEVIGHSCVSEPLLHCDQPGCEFCKEDCSVARAIKTSHPAEAIGFVHHKAGYEIPVRIRAVPVHNQRGSIIGAAEIFEELQPSANLGARDNGVSLPGCIDEVTHLASHAVMRSHLLQTLATFVEVQVLSVCSACVSKACLISVPAWVLRQLPNYCALWRVPWKVRYGPRTMLDAGATICSLSS